VSAPVSPSHVVLDELAGARLCAFLGAALPAARANASWPDLRAAAVLLSAASPAVHGGLGPALGVELDSGLPPYPIWARLKADWRVARDELSGMKPPPARPAAGDPPALGALTAADARLRRRRYHDALRAAPAPRMGDLDLAVRAAEKGGARRVHVVLDKVEASGVLVRIGVDLTIAKAVEPAALEALLLPLTSLPVELTLVRLLTSRGVLEVERVTRGAVDLVACAVVPPALELLRGVEGAGACALSFSTCARDVTPGDNDPLFHEAPALATVAREHLGSSSQGALGHRVFRDRKFVVTPAAEAPLRALAERARKKTILYVVDPAAGGT
jgi:hypothetical protein